MKILPIILMAFLGIAILVVSCDYGVEIDEDQLITDRAEGFWRIYGTVTAPAGWNPLEDENLFVLGFLNCVTGDWDPIDYSSDGYIEWEAIYTTPSECKWAFVVQGSLADHGILFFEPHGFWWSHPDGDPPNKQKTMIWGYVIEEGVLYVLKDSDWVWNPHYIGIGPRRYTQGGYWYTWQNADLDLTD